MRVRQPPTTRRTIPRSNAQFRLPRPCEAHAVARACRVAASIRHADRQLAGLEVNPLHAKSQCLGLPHNPLRAEHIIGVTRCVTNRALLRVRPIGKVFEKPAATCTGQTRRFTSASIPGLTQLGCATRRCPGSRLPIDLRSSRTSLWPSQRRKECRWK